MDAVIETPSVEVQAETGNIGSYSLVAGVALAAGGAAGYFTGLFFGKKKGKEEAREEFESQMAEFKAMHAQVMKEGQERRDAAGKGHSGPAKTA